MELQPVLDASLEAKAKRFLAFVIPYDNIESTDAFLNSLASNSYGSSITFIRSIVVLISSASHGITTAAMKMIEDLIWGCSEAVNFALLKADLIPQLIITLNPLSLSFAEAAVHETILKQVLVPSEKYICHLCMNRLRSDSTVCGSDISALQSPHPLPERSQFSPNMACHHPTNQPLSHSLDRARSGCSMAFPDSSTSNGSPCPPQAGHVPQTSDTGALPATTVVAPSLALPASLSSTDFAADAHLSVHHALLLALVDGLVHEIVAAAVLPMFVRPTDLIAPLVTLSTHTNPTIAESATHSVGLLCCSVRSPSEMESVLRGGIVERICREIESCSDTAALTSLVGVLGNVCRGLADFRHSEGAQQKVKQPKEGEDETEHPNEDNDSFSIFVRSGHALEMAKQTLQQLVSRMRTGKDDVEEEEGQRRTRLNEKIGGVLIEFFAETVGGGRAERVGRLGLIWGRNWPK
ncbi:hypothetical protein BLNAU_1155 [Blattamonas nauphoetae]|uniref:Uncharacterized protein n=1 Tax=Blattamonas nauphoetae TaxID=2049346 RepID=A0ABQ9YK05_9EUKA|nr:hypothetical protein BLNAU_1155 [Blattamonas nauphoetae]